MGAIAQIPANVNAVSRGSGAAMEVFNTPSAIDASKDDGIVPESCEGSVEAINTDFTCPSRPDATILNNYSEKIASGQTVAFAGSSGC